MKLNWRTALVVAELEGEIEALARGRTHRQQLKVGWLRGASARAERGRGTPACVVPLSPPRPKPCLRTCSLNNGSTRTLQELLNKKDMVGDCFNQLRLARQRALNAQDQVRRRSPRQGGTSVGAPRCAGGPSGQAGGALFPPTSVMLACTDLDPPQPAPLPSQVRLYEHLGPTASYDDEREVSSAAQRSTAWHSTKRHSPLGASAGSAALPRKLHRPPAPPPLPAARAAAASRRGALPALGPRMPHSFGAPLNQFACLPYCRTAVLPRQVNDTLGQLLTVMQVLDEEIGKWRGGPGAGAGAWLLASLRAAHRCSVPAPPRDPPAHACIPQPHPISPPHAHRAIIHSFIHPSTHRPHD